MNELEVLRQRLSSIQKTQAAQRLSERNCIEIILKMLELKMVDLIHTTTGKEYITPKQLELEINDEILRCGGRIAITDLQPIIQVDIKYIQDTVDLIVKKDRSIAIVYGEIITKYYMDSIMEETNETLQVVGKLFVNDLALRFGLQTEVLIEAITNRLGKKIHGIFENNEVLYTKEMVDRHKSRVRGLFTAITKPTPINSLCKQYNMNDRMFNTHLNELIQEKRINGNVQGKGSQSIFMPASFLSNRTKWIESFYKQNQYVAYSTLSSFQIPDPSSYLKNMFNDGIALSTCFISNHIIDNIEESIKETVSSSAWLDISSIIPSILNNKDISMVLSNCPSMKNKEDSPAIVLNEFFIASNTFIDRAYGLLDKMIQQKVQKQLILQESIVTSQSSLTISSDGMTKVGSQQQQKGKQQQSKGGRSKQDSDDEQDAKPTKSKSNKKGGKKQKSKDDSDDDEPYQQQKSSKKKQPQIDHLPDIIQIFKKSFENMEEELIQSLAQHLRPRVNQMWDTMVKEAKEKLENETKETRKGKQNELAAQFTTQYLNLQLFVKGLESIDDSLTILHKHLLKTVCNNITNIIVEANANYHVLENTTCDTPAQRTAILSQLPSSLSKSLDKLIQTLNKNSVKDFLEILETVCELTQIHMKSLDKKTEKTLLETHQKSLWEELEVESDIGNQFQAIVLITFIQYKKHLVHAPPRFISTLVQILGTEKSIDKPFIELVKSTQQDVVNYIKDESSATESDLSNLKDNIQKLKSTLLSLSSLSSTSPQTPTISNDQ